MGIFDTAFNRATQRDNNPFTARTAGKMVSMILVEHARVRVNAARAARRQRRGGGGAVAWKFEGADEYSAPPH